MNSEQLIQITTKAQQQIKKIFSDQEKSQSLPHSQSDGLRIAVIGGGCSGLQYKIEFSPQKEKDNILSYDGFNVFIDPKSTIYLKGIVLDFKDGLNGKGFVFDNPNAKNTCGCGESFSI